MSVEGGHSLAIKRSRGHASAKDAVAMVAGEPRHGALKHTYVVARYETRVAMAQHVFMRSFYHGHYDDESARGNDMAVEPTSTEATQRTRMPRSACQLRRQSSRRCWLAAKRFAAWR